MNARRCALLALSEWENTSLYAEEILSDLAHRHQLSRPDRALAVDLLYGVIRNLFFLDRLIDDLRHGSIKPGTQDLLRLGLYQIFLSEIADHAAVHETVALARKHERGLVNAILRTALRQRNHLENEIVSWPLEDRFSHPQFLIDRWVADMGEEAAASLCRWNNTVPCSYARYNPLARDHDALEQAKQETETSRIGERFPDFFRFEGPPDPEWVEAGLIYVQDPSTSVAPRLLNAQPGETVLDACAAPGGKTSLLAAAMQNEGILLATDNSKKRLERTRQNLDRLGVTIAELRAVDWTDPENEENFPQFDAILLDVPCSNSGVMRRRVDVRWRLQPGDFSHQAELQARFLKSARRHLKRGGRIVYSTCSVDREENERVVEASGMTVERIEQTHPWKDEIDGSFAALLRD
ncbi:MAG: 16S rRNA (cytosine(967)-C(5))-methyltransferase RsmB [Verrucomicrobiota bacterium]